MGSMLLKPDKTDYTREVWNLMKKHIGNSAAEGSICPSVTEKSYWSEDARADPSAILRLTQLTDSTYIGITRHDDLITIQQQCQINQKWGEIALNKKKKLKHMVITNVNTIYKRKADKVRPVDADVSQTDGSGPGGLKDWRKKHLEAEALLPPGTGPFDQQYLIKKFSTIPRGKRLNEERKKKLSIGIDLLPREYELFLEMLYNREKALSWDFSEIGCVHEDVAPPQEIRTIPHKPWQQPSFRIHHALRSIVESMLRERLRYGVLEPGHGSYRNSWYLVAKKPNPGPNLQAPTKKGEGIAVADHKKSEEPKKYRLINAATQMNAVTIRDATLPPETDSFSEDLSGCTVASLIDLFSGYDQIPLAEKSRDLTGFDTPLGLVRQTTIPMGATNSVGQFVRIMTTILQEHISEQAKPFLDDVVVKGPKTTYDGEEVEPGMRRYIVEHIRWLDGVLADIERAGCTISGAKSAFLCDKLKVVGYVVDIFGRRPDADKVMRIIAWKTPENPTQLRAFLGVATYYRIWIEKFSVIAKDLFQLLKNEAEWIWTDSCTQAMDLLKRKLTEAPALICLDYSDNAGVIYLAVDSSGTGWGACLMQAERTAPYKRHPTRYESGCWNSKEALHDPGKRECRGVLCALKKLRPYLYGVNFVLEVDARVLVAQFNKAASDLPNSVMARWVAWIRLFDFEVRHVPGKKHSAADGLSRRPYTDSELTTDMEGWSDPDDLIDATFFANTITRDTENIALQQVLEGNYSNESRELAYYLTTLRKPARMTAEEFRQLRKKAKKFVVKERTLLRQSNTKEPLQVVLDDMNEQQAAIFACHESNGHRGREGTYQTLRHRYYWPRMVEDIDKWVKACPQCGYRNQALTEAELHPTMQKIIGQRWSLDVVHVDRTGCLVIAREALSSWPEYRCYNTPSKEVTARQVASFIYEEIFCRHGICQEILVDGGHENRGEVEILLASKGVKRVRVSAYHPMGNGQVERGHAPIIDALAKLTNGSMNGWKKHLPAVFWSDRTTVKRTTGYSPADLIYGHEVILPIEMEYPTFNMLDWNTIHTQGELLAYRARQLERRREEMPEIMDRQARARQANKAWFDDRQRVSEEHLPVGSLVLIHRDELKASRSHKLAFRWKGPYRIVSVNEATSTYLLGELDGAVLQGTYARRRLKPVPEFRMPEAYAETTLKDIEEPPFEEANIPETTIETDHLTGLEEVDQREHPTSQVMIPRANNRSEYEKW